MNIDEYIQQPGQSNWVQRDDILRSMHVALPGEIYSYDPDTRTAVVQPVIRGWKSREDPPLLFDVPVFFLNNIVYTVSEGDECLVVFADTCIDSWFENGGVSTSMSERRHDLSDGFAFVGFKSKGNVTPGKNLDTDFFLKDSTWGEWEGNS